MSVNLYSWEDGLRATREQWASLVQTTGANPSLHPEWLDATLSAWGLTDRARIADIALSDGTRAVIPYILQKRSLLGLPFMCLELCSNIFCYHGEVVCEGNVAEAIAAFLACQKLPRWDAFRVDNTSSDGLTAAALRSLDAKLVAGRSVRLGEQSPYLKIESNWNDYLMTRPKKVRANISRAIRLMREAGETGMVWYETGGDTQRLLNDILHIELRSWKLDEGVAIIAGTPQAAYYERLLPWLAKNGLFANVLYVKNEPVAYVLCARWNGWVGQLKTSFAKHLGDAGARVIHSSMERAFELSSREYDFLGDAAPHKMRWTDTVRSHQDHWIFRPHVRGRLLARMKALTDRFRSRQRQTAAESV